jgi:pimeloyl-ACP methyl ester carboxylesterase
VLGGLGEGRSLGIRRPRKGEDYSVPYVLWHGVADTLPNTTLRLFARSGHQPFLEQPEEFASTLADWMARQANDAP